jgi:hypothetical protein
MNELIMIMGSMIIAMLLGAVFVLLIGGSTTLKYMRVKTGRGNKVLVFLKTNFGWKPIVATKEENTLFWKNDDNKYITDIEDEKSLTRYGRVDCAYINLKYPTVALKLGIDSLYPSDFDPETFNNLLVRAATRPNATEADQLKKMISVILVLVILVGIAAVLIFGKVAALQKSIEALTIIGGGVV